MPSSPTPDLDVRPFGAALGAEIHGVDVRDAGAPAVRAAIRAALLEHHVLFFRKQDITPEHFPIVVNGNFKPVYAEKALDPLHARCFVLDD